MMTRKDERKAAETDRADPRDGRAGDRNPDRRAWPLRRADRDPALPLARRGRADRLVRGAGAARKLRRAQAGARQGQRGDLGGRARPHQMGLRAASSRTSWPTTSCPT